MLYKAAILIDFDKCYSFPLRMQKEPNIEILLSLNLLQFFRKNQLSTTHSVKYMYIYIKENSHHTGNQ